MEKSTTKLTLKVKAEESNLASKLQMWVQFYKKNVYIFIVNSNMLKIVSSFVDENDEKNENNKSDCFWNFQMFHQ